MKQDTYTTIRKVNVLGESDMHSVWAESRSRWAAKEPVSFELTRNRYWFIISALLLMARGWTTSCSSDDFYWWPWWAALSVVLMWRHDEGLRGAAMFPLMETPIKRRDKNTFFYYNIWRDNCYCFAWIWLRYTPPKGRTETSLRLSGDKVYKHLPGGCIIQHEGIYDFIFFLSSLVLWVWIAP